MISLDNTELGILIAALDQTGTSMTGSCGLRAKLKKEAALDTRAKACVCVFSSLSPELEVFRCGCGASLNELELVELQ